MYCFITLCDPRHCLCLNKMVLSEYHCKYCKQEVNLTFREKVRENLSIALHVRESCDGGIALSLWLKFGPLEVDGSQ